MPAKEIDNRQKGCNPLWRHSRFGPGPLKKRSNGYLVSCAPHSDLLRFFLPIGTLSFSWLLLTADICTAGESVEALSLGLRTGPVEWSYYLPHVTGCTMEIHSCYPQPGPSWSDLT